MDADIVGLAEFRPEFKTGGRMARDLFGETYGNSAIGPVCGANCNAIFTRSFAVSGERYLEYAQRKQQRNI